MIKSLATISNTTVTGVRLLGCDATLDYLQKEDGLEIHLPAQEICDYVHCFQIRTNA